MTAEDDRPPARAPGGRPSPHVDKPAADPSPSPGPPEAEDPTGVKIGPTDAATPAEALSSRRSGALRSSFAPNDLVAGRFLIVRFIAAGGMGEVYEAEDLELKERMALKTVRPEIAEDQTAMERFRREIQLARRVTHPSVCRTFDLFRHRLTPPPGWEGPTHEITFLTMELLEGQTLAERLRAKGPMTTEEALPIVRQVASALAAAHDAGIVHRDFKSANVQLVPSKKAEKGVRAVVTDFGLARGGSTAAGRDVSITATGALAGTPAYMAPEQVEGKDITPATDVYALGVVMYEMVTGRRPFEGDTPVQTAVKRLKEKPPSPRTHVPGLDPRWETVILACLERDPADRFASTLDVVRALTGQPLAAAKRRRRAGRRAAAAAALSGLLLLGAAAWLLRSSPPAAVARRPAPTLEVKARRAVAVLGFKNLSGREDAAWLTKALAEMLTMELGAGEKLRTIPGENVTRMKVEMSLSEAERLAPDTLKRIRANLGTDLVVLGSYFASGKDAGGRLRVDLQVQDAAEGETIASVTQTGTESELLDVVSRAGSELRQKLGVGELSAAQTGGVKAALPSNPKAARLYVEGLDRLRLFDALAARDLLEQAVAADPSSPLVHSGLAAAWSALGYDANAKEEARKAFDLSTKLSREERLWVEGRYHEAAQEWDQAIETYRTLRGFFPDNLEYGLRLASAQAAAGKGNDGLATVEALRKLPAPARDDPRIDLAETETAYALSDYRREQTAAARAAEKGAAQGARLLVARARLSEAWASSRLGNTKAALAAADEARRIYAAVGDRGGVARVLNRIAVVFTDQGDLSAAEKTYQDSLAISRDIGDRKFTARTLNNMAEVLRLQGELAKAKRMYEESLAISRETGDRGGAIVPLSNLAEVLYAQGDLPGAKKGYEESLAAARETGRRMSMGTALRGIGDVFSTAGQLAEASSKYEEARAILREIGDRVEVPYALLGLARVAAAQGDIARARQKHQEALAVRQETGDKGGIAESRLALATLSIEEGRPAEAEGPAREASEEFRKEKRGDNEASAHAVLARALLDQGKLAEAQATIDEARALAKKSQNPAVRLTVAITAARVGAASGRVAEVRRSLDAALAEATKAGFVGLEFEVRLAAGEIEMRSGNSGAGRSRLLVLEQEASKRGLALVARKAKKAAS